MHVDVAGARQKAQIVDVESRRDHAHCGIDERVAALLGKRHTRGTSGERRRQRVDSDVLVVPLLEVVRGAALHGRDLRR